MNTDGDNALGELLADPAVIRQVQPLLNAAIDARLAPMAAQLENLTKGVTLMAQAAVEQAKAQTLPEPQPPPPAPAPFDLAGQAPAYQPTPPTPPAAVDKLAAFAPLLMQYLTGQSNNGANNLGNIAETLAAAAQIGNVMNAPMFQGMRMATDMMSMAGRAGIEPTTAADTLGGMIDGATNKTAPAPEARQDS
jgi:hypothetical protein